MPKKPASNTVAIPFAATWQWRSADKPSAHWRPLGTTPGTVKLAPDRVFRVELAPEADDAAVGALLALLPGAALRSIVLPNDGAITRAGLLRLAALPGITSASTRCGYDPDTSGRHDWTLRLRLAEFVALEVELPHWPGEDVAAVVGAFSDLTKLEWEGEYHQGAFDIRPLFALTALRNLKFSGRAGDAYDWSGLARLTELRELELDEGDYDATCWKEVGQLANLETFCLHRVEKADTAPGSLQKLTNLKELKITPQIVPLGTFWRAVGRLPAVEKLSVEHGTIDADMAAALGSLTTMRTGYFWGVEVADAELASLCRMRELRSLVLCEDQKTGAPVSDAGFRELRHLTQLESLQLQGFEGVSPTGWECLRDLERLTELKIFSSPLHDYLAAIGPLPTVETLDLTHCNSVTAAGWAVVPAMPALRTLSIDAWSSRPYHDPIPEISRAKQLRSLSLRDLKRTSDADLATLTALRQLQALELLETKKVTDAGIAALSHFPNLRKVRLRSLTKLTDQSLRVLGALPKLRDLTLRCTGKMTDKGFAALATASKLETLHLDYARTLTEDRLLALAAALPLRALTIHECPDLTDAGVMELTRYPKLKRVDLWGCKNVTQAGRAAMFAARPDWGDD